MSMHFKTIVCGAAVALSCLGAAVQAQDAVPEAQVQGPSGQETFSLQVTGVDGVTYFCRPTTRFNADLGRVERPCRRADSFTSAQSGVTGDAFSGIGAGGVSIGGLIAVVGGIALVVAAGGNSSGT